MLLPSLLFSLLGAFAVWLFVRRNPATEPRFTVAVLAILLLLPFLHFLPKFTVLLTASPAPPTDSHSQLLPALWFTGFLFFALRGLLDILSLARWNRRSRPAGDLPVFEQTLAELKISRRVELRIHPDLNSPVVSGLRSPRIHLPESATTWSADTLKMALLHELGHVQRGDLWMAGLARLVCIFHWFNPAVWWLRRSFHSQCEFACDAHLVKQGTDPRIYAHALCDVARSAAAPPLSLAMAGHVPLRERILFLSRGGQRGSLALCAAIALTASSAIAMSLIRFAPENEGSSTSFPDRETELRFTADPFPAD